MTPDTVMSMTHIALRVALSMAGPLLITALIIGLVVSIFQAATQINEMTLSFILNYWVLLLYGAIGTLAYHHHGGLYAHYFDPDPHLGHVANPTVHS